MKFCSYIILLFLFSGCSCDHYVYRHNGITCLRAEYDRCGVSLSCRDNGLQYKCATNVEILIVRAEELK